MSEKIELPGQHAFLHAILRHLVDRPDGDRRGNIHDAMPALLGLTEAQRNDRLPNLPHHLRYRYRSGYGLSMLKAAGYVESGGPAIWQITTRGRDLIRAFPDAFDAETAKRIVRESRTSKDTDPEIDDSTSDPDASSPSMQLSPDERIAAALKELHSVVAAELLDKIFAAPPAFFEQLVLDLLHALGYGMSTDDLVHVGAAGDGGIDGIISLDRLGFEKVYVQAKRWQNSVGRPEIQAFFGALAGRKARKGVFITTSCFTREAKLFGEQISESVVLIDGVRLTELMIENGVGVTHYRVIRLPRVDSDYFEDR